MLNLLAVITEVSGSTPPEMTEIGGNLATSGGALLLFRSLILDPLTKNMEKRTELLKDFVEAYADSVKGGGARG